MSRDVMLKGQKGIFHFNLNYRATVHYCKILIPTIV